MKKRLFAMFLALVMIVSVLPLAAFAADENDKCISTDGKHRWDSNTGKCTNSRWVGGNRQRCEAQCSHSAGYNTSGYNKNKCKTCGMAKPSCQHTYSSTDGKCTKCGETCSHKYNKYNPTGKCTTCNFTCTHKNGYTQNKCKDCGMTKCNTHEYKNGVCENCGYACGHSETQLIPRVEATCSTPGSKNGYKCKACGVIRQQPEIIPATGEHKYEVFVGYDGEEPTCTTPGVKIYKCNTCELTDNVSVTAEHKEKILAKQEATCAQEGYIFYTCELCGHDRHETFKKLSHTEKILPVVPATCTESGLKAGKQCSVCEEVLLEQEVVAALGHDWKTVAAKAATCTANGNNQYKECNRCHATLNKEIIPAAHDFSQNPNKCAKCGARNPGCQHKNGSITVTKEATCKATGTQTFKCTDCGDTFVQTLPQLTYHNYVNGTCTWCRAESCSHSYHTERVEPTCTENGYERTYCDKCDKEQSSRILNKTGHNFNNNVIDNFCTKCGCANPNAQQSNDQKTGELTNDLQDIFVVG